MRTADDLLRDLARARAVPSGWGEAVAAVDRALFIPARIESADAHRDLASWRDLVYSDSALITQFNDGRELGADAFQRPSSSSSMPSIMLEMLDLLDVEDGHCVLEVGTGTGYSTAWLCHRLGDDRVTSIEYDETVLAQARVNLAAAGHAPHLVLGDGLKGHPPHAPYDRVQITCTVRGWGDLLSQCPDGRIVAPWGTSFFASSFVSLDVRGGIGEGRFTSDPAFMWDRLRRAGAGHVAEYYHRQEGTPGTTRVPPQNTLQTDPAFFVSLAVTDAWWRWCAADDGSGEATLWLLADDKTSWATVGYAPGAEQFGTDQYGPRRLWDEVEAAYRLWTDLGTPSRDRFALTVTPQHQHVRLTPPGTPWSTTLPA